MRAFDFFFGKYIVSTDAKNAVRLLNLCMNKRIEYDSPRFADGMFCVSCHRNDYRKLSAICKTKDLKITLKRESGLPGLIASYKHRIGLFIGAFLGACILWLSLSVIWRIDVYGNETISADRIKMILNENDFSVGSLIGKSNLTSIENKIMEDNGDIAWISINVNGTIANVEVRETKAGIQKDKSVSDLVASRDGKVERIEAYDGNCLVKIGDIVRAGEVLVSGKYSDDSNDTRTTRAEGEIYARTVRSFFIEIPFKNYEKVYTGRKYSEIYINFFENHIKVFANTGNLPSSCDIIYKNERIGLPGADKIPIGTKTIEYLEYEMRSLTLDEENAMKIAFDELDKKMEALSESVELLEKNIEFEINENAYVLKCTLVCIENIATRR